MIRIYRHSFIPTKIPCDCCEDSIAWPQFYWLILFDGIEYVYCHECLYTKELALKFFKQKYLSQPFLAHPELLFMHSRISDLEKRIATLEALLQTPQDTPEA